MAVDRIEIADLLAQRFAARGLDLSSRRRVLTELSGPRLSGFRGRGMEFEEHRRYVAGDEVRSIDWRVTARTGVPHVRGYREERERPVLLAVDLRAPMWFGTRGCFKAVQAARAAAGLAWAATANGDRIGALVFGADHRELRPAGGRRGVMRLIQALAAEPPSGPGMSLATASLELRRLARPGALLILLSDLHDLDEPARQNLQLTTRHCELVIGMVSDPLERRAPPPGRYPLWREGLDEPAVLDTRDPALARDWTARYEQRLAGAQAATRACRAHWLALGTETPVADALTRGFGRR